MKTLLPSLGMIVFGVLLALFAYSPTARFVISKIDVPNIFLKPKPLSEADDLSLMIVPLILGLFLLGAGVVLFVVFLFRLNAT
jgi:hypothetical protein